MVGGGGGLKKKARPSKHKKQHSPSGRIALALLVILPLGNKHIIENPDFAKNYQGDMFWITGKARASFHLAVIDQSTLK